jgi:hypothetical protein
MHTNVPSYSLGEPGAGLPVIELRLLRCAFNAGRRITPVSAIERTLAREKERILEIVSTQTADRLAEHTLIRRLPGLEDSSRYWSVFMTLSHLATVNRGITNAIELLSRGEVPPHPVRIAEVKPSVEAGTESVGAFAHSCEALIELGRTLGRRGLATAAHYEHPWFGRLDARGWYFLAGVHMRLHRAQIRLILSSERSVSNR